MFLQGIEYPLWDMNVLRHPIGIDQSRDLQLRKRARGVDVVAEGRGAVPDDCQLCAGQPRVAADFLVRDPERRVTSVR